MAVSETFPVNDVKVSVPISSSGPRLLSSPKPPAKLHSSYFLPLLLYFLPSLLPKSVTMGVGGSQHQHVEKL